jgi:hypothetical protein
VDGTGTIIEVTEKEPRVLQFEHFAITPEEQAIALKSFSFRGIPEGVNPLTTLGIWDSHIYQRTHDLTDEQRIEVEEALRRKGERQNWRRFIIVEKPKAPKPWPTFDEDSPGDVVDLALRLNLVDAAVAYESENQAREDVLRALSTEDAVVDKVIEVSV